MGAINGPKLIVQEKKQGIKYMFGIMGLPAQPIAPAAANCGYRVHWYPERASSPPMPRMLWDTSLVVLGKCLTVLDPTSSTV